MRKTRAKAEIISIDIEGQVLTEFEVLTLDTVAAAARVGYDLCKTTTMSREDVGIYVRKAWLESIVDTRKTKT